MRKYYVACEYLLQQGLMQVGDITHTVSSGEYFTVAVRHHVYTFNNAGCLVATDE